MDDVLEDQPANSKMVSHAKCNGVTDDTIAIQNAVNSGSIDLPPGSICVVSKAIAIPSYRAIFGRGATLKLKDGASDHVLKNADFTNGNTNIRIQDLIVDHNGVATGGNTIAILLNRVTRSVVTDNKVVNVRVHGILLSNGSTDNVVNRNTLDTFGSSSIGTGITAFRGSHRNTIADNTIRNGAVGTYGILIDDASDGDANSRPSNDNVVIGNTISRTPYGIGVEGSSANRIEGNIIDGVTRVGVDISSGFNNGPSSDNVVKRNRVSAVSGSGAAIQIVGRNLLVADNMIDGVSGIARSLVLNTDHGAATPQSNIVVRGNRFRGHTSSQPVIRIAPTTVNGLAIERNVIESAVESGIDTSGGGMSWRIAGNMICGARKSGVRVNAGVSGLMNLTVEGNFIRLETIAEITQDPISINGPGIDRVIASHNVALYSRSSAVNGVVAISNAANTETTGNVAAHSPESLANGITGAATAVGQLAVRICAVGR